MKHSYTNKNDFKVRIHYYADTVQSGPESESQMDHLAQVDLEPGESFDFESIMSFNVRDMTPVEDHGGYDSSNSKA
jgi:hypothetical protein